MGEMRSADRRPLAQGTITCNPLKTDHAMLLSIGVVIIMR